MAPATLSVASLTAMAGLQRRLAADAGAAAGPGAAAVGRGERVAGDDAHLRRSARRRASATIWRMMASVPWPCSVTPVAATTEPSGSMRTVQPSCAEMRAPPMPYMKGLGLVSSMKLAKPMPRWMPLRAQPLLLGAQAG